MIENFSVNFELIKHSVVMVYSYDFDGNEIAQGSGVILKEKGILVTNCHIYSKSESIKVKHLGQIISFEKIIGIDVENDILLIKLDTESFPQITIANSIELISGHKIFTISSPKCNENSYSEGSIIGVDRVIVDKAIRLGFRSNKQIQFTANISEGSSGGAIFNENLELVGIISSQTIGMEIINFAIPIDKVLDIIDSSNEKDTFIIDASHFYYVGNNAFETQNFEAAIKYYTRYLEIYSDNYDVLVRRSFAYTENKSYEEAMKDCEKALDLCLDKSEAYAAKAQIYYCKNDWENCIVFYLKALKIDLYYFECNFNLSFCYYKQSKYIEALQYMNMVLKIEPLMFQGLHLAGNCYFEMNENIPALEMYNNLSEISNVSAGLYIDIGNSYHKQARFDDALIFYNKAQEIEPQNPLIFQMKGICYIELNNEKDALENINKSIELSPGSFGNYFTRATFYSKFGKLEDSINDFTKCLEIEDSNYLAYCFRGIALFRSGLYEHAIKDMEQTIILYPDYEKKLRPYIIEAKKQVPFN